MARITRRTLIASSAAFAAIPYLASAQATPGASPISGPVIDSAEAIDARIRDAFPTLSVPGALVLVQHPSIGVFTGAYGVGDLNTGAPMSTDMRFRIGSNTKTFTATAMLRLIDAGLASLESTIADVAPDLAFLTNADRITMRHLLGMRAGLPDFEAERTFVEANIVDPHRAFTGMELLEMTRGRAALFEPDAENHYSNTNYLVLALITERLTGKRYTEVIAEQLLQPLGLNDTFVLMDSSIPVPHPRGYMYPLPDEFGPPPTDWGTPVAAATPVNADGAIDCTEYNASFMLGSTNMASTLADLNTWINAVVDGSLLSSDLHREQLTARPEGTNENPGEEGYGFGIVKFPTYWGHNGMVNGFHSLTMRHQSEPLSIVMVGNAFPGKNNELIYDKMMIAITGADSHGNTA